MYCRSLGHYLIFTDVLESVIGISNPKICWYVHWFILLRFCIKISHYIYGSRGIGIFSCWLKLLRLSLLCRSILTPTRLNYVTLGVPKCWYVLYTLVYLCWFFPYSWALSFISWMVVDLNALHYLDWHLTGKRGTKYFIHMFQILQSSWAYIWSNRVLFSHWYLVCWLRFGWVASWTCWYLLLWALVICYIYIRVPIYNRNAPFYVLFQPLFPGESGVDQLVEIIKVIISLKMGSLKNFSPHVLED